MLRTPALVVTMKKKPGSVFGKAAGLEPPANGQQVPKTSPKPLSSAHSVI
jgi:hypothetical protein